jgi:hypothetical protein
MDLYIYYRAPLDNAPLLQQETTAMQARLSQQYAVTTALKRRPQETAGMHTWMEVYLEIPDGFSAALEQAVSEHQLASLIDGPRHTEQFLDFSPCA